MIVRIQVRRGTSTQWTNANPVLSSGEFGYETDTERIKIGNGTDAWNVLSYLQTSGLDGKSAYQIAVENGFIGTELQWIDSLTPFTYLDADIFSGDGETEETKFTIVNGGIVEAKLSTSVQDKLNSVLSDASQLTSGILSIERIENGSIIESKIDTNLINSFTRNTDSPIIINKIWAGTQAQYDALTPDPNTAYDIIE